VRDFIIHAKTAEPKARQNLAPIFGYLHSDASDSEDLLRAMKRNRACGGLARTGAITLERREAQEEFSAILSTMQEDLDWLTDPQVGKFLPRSDVDVNIPKGSRR
jgi:type IV secretion system protein VirD4